MFLDYLQFRHEIGICEDSLKQKVEPVFVSPLIGRLCETVSNQMFKTGLKLSKPSLARLFFDKIQEERNQTIFLFNFQIFPVEPNTLKQQRIVLFFIFYFHFLKDVFVDNLIVNDIDCVSLLILQMNKLSFTVGNARLIAVFNFVIQSKFVYCFRLSLIIGI